MFHCAEGEGRAGETHYANRRILKAGRPGSLLEGDPNLKWILGREFMEAQRDERQTTACGTLRQTSTSVDSRWRILARRIESVANPFELSRSDQSAR